MTRIIHCFTLLLCISDPFIFNKCSKDRSSDHYSCQRHSYGDLRELRQARFLLQDIALEVFFPKWIFQVSCLPQQ